MHTRTRMHRHTQANTGEHRQTQAHACSHMHTQTHPHTRTHTEKKHSFEVDLHTHLRLQDNLDTHEWWKKLCKRCAEWQGHRFCFNMTRHKI